MLERNYLDGYTYDSWSTYQLPTPFEVDEAFTASVCELREGQTSKPCLLTEADLVTLMDKNGIGTHFFYIFFHVATHDIPPQATDARIAQHIQTLIEWGYIIEHMEGSVKYLVPSALGIGLIEGYNAIGVGRSLSKPQLIQEVNVFFF